MAQTPTKTYDKDGKKPAETNKSTLRDKLWGEVQWIVGIVLYYVHIVSIILLMASSTNVSESAKATKHTWITIV